MAPRVLIVGALTASLVMGCGGSPSAEQRRTDRAAFVRAANAVCEKANREIADDNPRPKYGNALEQSLTESRASLQAAAVSLHALRGDLDESSTSRIDAFDRAIDPFVTSLGSLATAYDTGERQRAAIRVRRRGDALYQAARAVKLDRCGRGGNTIAERATFFDYRKAYTIADDSTLKQIAGIDTSSTRADVFAGHRAVTRAARRQYRATGNMKPPRELRRLHQAVRRSLNAVLKTRALLTPSITRERGTMLFAQLDRQFPRYQHLERQLRRQLNR